MRAARARLPHGPEDRGVAERCILGFNAGPPYNPSALQQQRPYLSDARLRRADWSKWSTTARIVPMDGRPHLPANMRQWRGDARGRWEGDTLVVESRNFTDKTSFRGSGKNMRLTERFTRVADDKIVYRYTIDDPESFEKPWTAVIPMAKNDQPMFEYACHEGNESMFTMLAGARAPRRKKAKKRKTSKVRETMKTMQSRTLAVAAAAACLIAGGRRNGNGPSRLLRRVRRQPAADAQRHGDENAMDQSPRLDPYRSRGRERRGRGMGLCEGGTPNTLLRRGFDKNSLLPGTEIVVDGYQAKDGSNKMNGRDITFPDGRKLFMGSSGTGAPKDGRDPRRAPPLTARNGPCRSTGLLEKAIIFKRRSNSA